MAPFSFIVILKSILPETSWPWVIPALRQNPGLWNLLLKQDFGERATQSLEGIPQAWSPAHLAFLALGQPLPKVDANVDAQLRYQSVQALEAVHQKSAEEETTHTEDWLAQSALLAIALYEQRRNSGGWEATMAGLQTCKTKKENFFNRWSLPFAVLFGLTSDNIALLRSLLSSQHTQLHPLAANTFLSQPLSPSEQNQYLAALADKLEGESLPQLIRYLHAWRPGLAAPLAGRALSRPHSTGDGSFDQVSTLLSEITSLANQASVHAAAGQAARSIEQYTQAVNSARRLQASLAAQINNVFDEEDLDTSYAAWQEAISLSVGFFPPTRLLVGLLEAGRVDDAAELIPAGVTEDTVPGMAVIHAHLANRSGDRTGARQSAHAALTFLIRDLEEAGPHPISPDLVQESLPWLVHLSGFCQDISMPEESRRAARAATWIYPDDPIMLSALSQANLRLGDENEAVQAAHLAAAISPAESIYRRQLAVSQEKAGEWEAALQTWTELLELRFAPSGDGVWPTCADLRAQANCALNAGNPTLAIEACLRALELEPEDGLTEAVFGEALVVQGEEDKAMHHFEQATSLAPHQAAPWLSLARAHQRRGSAAKAVETLSAASHAVPSEPAVHLALAEAYLGEKAVTQAQASLRKAFELAKERPAQRSRRRLAKGRQGKATDITSDVGLLPRIALLYGDVLLQLGHNAKARQVLEETFMESPSYPGLAYAYARLLLDQGDFQAALSPLAVAVNKDPQNPLPSLDYAESLLRAGVQPDEAARALQHVLQLTDPPATQAGDEAGNVSTASLDGVTCPPVIRKTAQALLGQALERSGDLQGALQAYYQALEAGLSEDPQWKDSLAIGLGRTSIKLGEPETAIAALYEPAQSEKADPEVFMVLAQAYAAINLPEEAIQSAQNAIQHAPDNVDVLAWFASQMVSLGSKPDAIKTLCRAIQLEPERFDLLLQLAQVQYSSGDRQGAVGSYKQLASTASTAEILHQAGRGLIELGEASAAVTAFERALVEGGIGSHDILVGLAEAYRLTGNPEQALEVLDRAIRSDPQNINLQLGRADLLAKIGRQQAAQACLEHALNLDPTHPSAHFRIARLLRLQGDLAASIDHTANALAAWNDRPKTGEYFEAAAFCGELARAALRFDKARLQIPVPIPAGFSVTGACLAAELALEQDEEVAAAEALTVAANGDLTDPRVMALQARLAYRRGDAGMAASTLESALQSLQRLELRTKDDGMEVDIAELLGTGLAALDMQEWETALQLIRRAASIAPNEPYNHIQIARALTLRAEFEQLCQDLEIEFHSPGAVALGEEAATEFRSALLQVQRAAPGDEQPARSIQSRRWTARGQVVFHNHRDSLEALTHLAAAPDDFAALIAAHGRLEDIEAVKQEYRMAQAEAGTSSLHPVIQIQFALALDRLGKTPEELNEGLSAVLSAINQQPNLAYQHLLLARLAHKCSDSAVCLHALQTALALWPEEPRWHAQAARIQAEQDELASALHHLEQAVRLEPANIAHHLALGETLLRSGETRRAVRAVEQAHRLDPNGLEATEALSRAYLANGDYTEAARSAESAILLAPGRLEPLLLRGEIALRSGDPQTAQDYAEQVLQLHPEEPQALHLLGKALSLLGCTQEALSVIEQAIPLADEPLPLLLERVNLLECSRGQQAALEALANLIQQYPEEASILALLAGALARAGQNEAAIQAGQKSLRNGGKGLTSEQQASLHLQLGRLLRQAGQLDQAIHHLSEACRLAPRSIEAFLELGATQVDRRQSALALQTYQKAMAAAPRDPRPFLQAGLALKANRDYPGAESMLRRAADLAPDDLSIHRQLAALVALNLVHSHRPAVQEV